MKVRDLMTSDPATVGPDDVVSQAATLMREEDCGSLPVVKDATLVGIVTDRDIAVRSVAAGADPKRQHVSEIMSADPITIAPDSDADEAARMMAEFQVRRLPVVEDGHLLGIVVTAQLARRESAGTMGSTIKEISEPASGRASHARG
ncbi:MAG TPA: CBS domain-containing protein [Candidatus Acidoferrales bacterium]|nr:CBS domain-containing protein [Candidatus Acidoferrales bacterium]